MQEMKKSQNQDLRADPAWSINSGKMEFNPGDFASYSIQFFPDTFAKTFYEQMVGLVQNTSWEPH